MQTKIIERYFFFSLLLATLAFSLFIFRPFWIVLVLSISFSIVLFPIYKWFNKKLPNWLSAVLTVLIFVIAIMILLFGIAIIVLNQSQSVYNLFMNGNTLSTIDSINNSIIKILPQGLSFNLYEKISNIISFITNNVANLFTTTLSTAFAFFLTFLSMFYFLKDNMYWKKAIKLLSPLSDNDDEKIINKLSMAVNGILKGYLLLAFIQGSLVGIGFALFGIPNPALWALVAMVTALVPTIGSGLVTIPAIIFLLITESYLPALGLTIWGVAIVGTIDNILNPVIIGNKINLHPILIMFSALGGISLFGPIGILVGPLTVSLLYTLISIYRDEFRQNQVTDNL